MQLCGSLSILWYCLSLGLEWNLTFSSPVATAEFSKFAGILNAAHSQHHLLGFEIAQLEWNQVGLSKHHYEQSWGDGIHLHNHLQIISVDISLILFFPFGLSWVFVAAHKLSLVAERGCYSLVAVLGFSWFLLLWSTGSRKRDSVVAADRLTCPRACGILEQGSNPCPLHWQVDS